MVKTPVLSNKKIVHTSHKRPRTGSIPCRGSIQYATPNTKLSIHPIKSHSMCTGSNRHINGDNGIPLLTNIKAPIEKPATKYSNAARMNQTLNDGISFSFHALPYLHRINYSTEPQ